MKLFFLLSVFSFQVLADYPTDLILSNGVDLNKKSSRNVKLSWSKGLGGAWNSDHEKTYQEMFDRFQFDPQAPVQWALWDLKTGETLSQSEGGNWFFYGASVSKAVMASALLEYKNGVENLGPKSFQDLIDMIVVSDNQAWGRTQGRIGEGDQNFGRQRIHDFTQALGMGRTRAFRGFLGDLHGNEISVNELRQWAQLLYDGKLLGSQDLLKIMATTRTGRTKARAYIPKDVLFAYKTGTYAGPTWDPRTGSDRNPDGSPFKVQVAHQMSMIKFGKKELGLIILTNRGKNRDVAIMAGGLFRQFAL